MSPRCYSPAPAGASATAPSLASCLRHRGRLTPSDERTQGRRQEHAFEIAIGNRRAQDLHPLGSRELPIEEDDVTVTDTANAAARPIADVTQQLLVANL